MNRDGWARWGLLVGLTAALTLVIAAFGVPSPALFAGLLVAAGLALAGRAPGDVPAGATGAAQAVIGVVIGLLARPGTLGAVAQSWLPVLLIAVGTLAVSMGAGLLMGVRRDVTLLTGMLALTAGGASGLVAVARELGGDERLVAVVQYLRVGIVTATMPVVAALAFEATVTGGAGPGAGPGAPWYVDLGFLAVCVAAGLGIARVTRVPAGGLLGPMAVALALGLAGATFGAAPPALVVEIAYAVIGWQAGVRFTRAALRTVLGALPLATALIAAVIVACAGLGLLLSSLTGVTPLEGYLATTPGGVYAVLATAISAGGDVTFVVAVQVIRVVLMLLVAPLLARLVGRRGDV
ncbi:AbrB family transcriptional regulator [Pseudonocardia hydrocarbonoxydans]|uniref:Membrane protein n=1 Tax=Pseudonocardia hydrocarbonoxydans TaxID=76726 RepID=A0A4Y3WHE2_9PSEU|nr:AbrB family transcriptional regulator [Pseudonocardia hydrocarbonoxydans]GEC18224.1 membrane protein [Pseudonocardia hydrocarbonoxydans]